MFNYYKNYSIEILRSIICCVYLNKKLPSKHYAVVFVHIIPLAACFLGTIAPYFQNGQPLKKAFAKNKLTQESV